MAALVLKETLQVPLEKNTLFFCSEMLQLLLHRKRGRTYIYVGKCIIKHNSYSQSKFTYLFLLGGTF